MDVSNPRDDRAERNRVAVVDGRKAKYFCAMAQ